MIQTSKEIDQISAAFVQAQKEFTPAGWDKTNDFLKYSYATLGSILEMLREPLHKNGLAILCPLDNLESDKVRVTMRLVHNSGQFMEATFSQPQPKEPKKGLTEIQTVQSLVTTMKRMAISALLGIYTDKDDDGAAEESHVKSVEKKENYRPRTIPTHEEQSKSLWTPSTRKQLLDSWRAASLAEDIEVISNIIGSVWQNTFPKFFQLGEEADLAKVQTYILKGDK
jgi:hypothetical protein